MLLSLAGCNMLSSPTQHARTFVAGLVEAESTVPPDLSEGMGARVALDYVRALRRQGAALEYRVLDSKPAAGGKRIVRLRVEPPRGPDLAHASSAPPPRFAVELEPDAATAWRIVRWWADD